MKAMAAPAISAYRPANLLAEKRRLCDMLANMDGLENSEAEKE
jgi:hypothetical protein